MGSVYNILKHLGIDVTISNDSNSIKKASHIILPGVGSFGSAIQKIMSKIEFDILEDEVVKKSKPFLGICVGKQVLADQDLEYGEHSGFGWVPGVVEKLNTLKLPVPHIGWNDIKINRDCPLFANLKEHRDFYFVHSFVHNTALEKHVVATTEFEVIFNSVIQKDNIFGIQFHPEKSQKSGQLLLNNFIKIK